MRFSIKWLLSFAAYAAVFCASVLYASLVWTTVLSLAGYLVLVAAIIGAALSRRPIRGFCIGFVIGAAAARGATYGLWAGASDVRAAVNYSLDRASQLLPAQVALAGAGKATSRSKYLIREYDFLQIDVGDPQQPPEITGEFQVDADGVVRVSPNGLSRVAGLSLQGAEQALARRIEMFTPFRPKVRIRLARPANPGIAPPGVNALRTTVLKQHFIALLSLLGGGLGWRIQTRQDLTELVTSRHGED